jgi:NADH-quinone oxidoreductase subunit M
LLMQFALIGVFVATDGFLYYIFWELALIPIYFIALLWGENKDKEFRNTAVFKFFVYTLTGSLFMLVAFIYLYSKAGSFQLIDLYNLELSTKEQWLRHFSWLLLLKYQYFLSIHGRQILIKKPQQLALCCLRV